MNVKKETAQQAAQEREIIPRTISSATCGVAWQSGVCMGRVPGGGRGPEEHRK